MISDAGKNQLRLAETYKYAHVTYFFNGLREPPFKNEFRALIPGRKALEEAMKELEKKYAGRAVPLPPHWGGFRLVPETVEFWQGRRSRLHDRLRYRRTTDGSWTVERLAP